MAIHWSDVRPCIGPMYDCALGRSMTTGWDRSMTSGLTKVQTLAGWLYCPRESCFKGLGALGLPFPVELGPIWGQGDRTLKGASRTTRTDGPAKETKSGGSRGSPGGRRWELQDPKFRKIMVASRNCRPGIVPSESWTGRALNRGGIDSELCAESI